MSNEGGSKANKVIGNRIIRKEKEDKTKAYNILENSIVTDTHNKAIISNTKSKKNILNDKIYNEVKVNNNYEVEIFQTEGNERTITLSNEGESKSNKLIGNRIIRKEKEDKTKVVYKSIFLQWWS